MNKEREARAAETRARNANTRLQTLLAIERERVRRLENQSAPLVQDLPYAPSVAGPAVDEAREQQSQ